jgi:cytochrome P450
LLSFRVLYSPRELLTFSFVRSKSFSWTCFCQSDALPLCFPFYIGFLVGSILVMALALIAIVALVAILLADLIHLNRGPRIPGTFRFPIVGDLFLLGKHFYSLFDYMSEKFQTMGNRPICMLVGRYRIWGIVQPTDVEHVLKGNWKNYTVGKGIRGDSLGDLFGDGIFHADGECWYTQRKTVSREFTMNNFKEFMVLEFMNYAKILRAKLVQAARSGTVVDLHAEYFKLTLDSFGKVAFGVDLGGLSGNPVPFAKAFDDAQDNCAWRVARKPPFLWKSQRVLNVGGERRMTECLNTINVFVSSLVEQRKKQTSGEERQDLFARLFMISETEKDEAKRLQYLRDMTVNFLIAGRDTTACALSWLSYELTKAPSIEKKLVEELQDSIPGEYPTYDDLVNCQYLTAVVHEALRLHPSVPFDIKHVEQDDVLPASGTQVKGGDSIAYIPYAMGRMHSIWGTDAEQFRPERWLDEEGKFVRADPFKYPVFQAGPRLCLGVDMAILEIKVVVALLYKKLSIKLVQEPHYRTGIVLQMLPPGLPCSVVER